MTILPGRRGQDFDATTVDTAHGERHRHGEPFRDLPTPRMAGPQAIAQWAEIGDEVARKREIIRAVADIKLLRVGKGSRQAFGAHRLEGGGYSAPDAEDDDVQAGTEGV